MSAAKKASPHVKAGFDPLKPLDPSRALVPSVVRLNEQTVARGFWPKLRKTAARVPFASEALAVWYCARDDATPTAAKGLMFAALAYFVLPTDVVPDFIAGLGFTDDAAVFAAMLALVGRNLKPRHREAAKQAIEKLRDDS
ncbi:MAG: YkvA family protein [Phenylobacterium sp.]